MISRELIRILDPNKPLNMHLVYEMLDKVYDSELKKAERDLDMTGKTLLELNKENASLQYYYDALRIEVESIMDFLEMELARRRSDLYKFYLSQNRDYSEKAKERLIDGDNDYLKLAACFDSAKEIREKFKSIVDAFRNRGFQIKNICDLCLAQIEDKIMT